MTLKSAGNSPADRGYDWQVPFGRVIR